MLYYCNMEFNKNSDLINKICLMQIKSIDNLVDIPSLSTIYHTPSKISLSKSSSHTDNGVLHKKRLSISYPGLSATDFEKFDELLRGMYQIFIKLDNHQIYEIASAYFPMSCAISYNINSGHSLVFTVDAPIPFKYRDTQHTEGINIDGFDYDFDFYVS